MVRVFARVMLLCAVQWCAVVCCAVMCRAVLFLVYGVGSGCDVLCLVGVVWVVWCCVCMCCVGLRCVVSCWVVWSCGVGCCVVLCCGVLCSVVYVDACVVRLHHVCIGVILGSFWSHLGVILGSFWVAWGSIWDQFLEFGARAKTPLVRIPWG